MNALASMDTLEGRSKPCESLCFVSDGCSVRLAARCDGAVESVRQYAILLCVCAWFAVRNTLVRPTMPAAADTAEDEGSFT